jgi:hypothetical protein
MDDVCGHGIAAITTAAVDDRGPERDQPVEVAVPVGNRMVEDRPGAGIAAHARIETPDHFDEGFLVDKLGVFGAIMVAWALP